MPSNLRNYVGGTIDDPCPTGGAFAWWAGKYCNVSDYSAWWNRSWDMFTQAITPTWIAYAQAAATADPGWVEADDLLHLQVEAYHKAWNNLPKPNPLAPARSQRSAVQRAVTLAVLGDQLVTKLQAATETLGAQPPRVQGTSDDDGSWLPDFELPGLPDLADLPDVDWPKFPPKVEVAVPWYVWAGGGVLALGLTVGIYSAVKPKGRRR